MAYFYDPLLEDKEKDGSEAPELAGGSQVVGGGSVPQAQGANAKGPTSSDQFQNLNSYLDANKDSSFGQDFAGKVKNDIDQAGVAQQQAGTNFQNLVDQSTKKIDTDLTNQALTDPYALTQDQDKTAAFKAQRDATYSGPNGFADSADNYSKAYGATKKAADTAQAAQTEGGRFALLDNYFARPEYNQGQKSLDNLLVQGNQDTMGALTQAKDNAQAYARSFDQEGKDLSNYAAQGKATTDKTAADTKSLLKNADDNAVYGLDQQVAARKADAFNQPRTFGAVKGKSSLADLSPEDQALFGVAPQDIGGVSIQRPSYVTSSTGDQYNAAGAGQFYGADPSAYLSAIADDQINRGSVADHATLNKIRALEQLSDQGTSAIANPQDVGKYTSGRLAQFNKGAFLGDVGNRQAAFKSDLDGVLKKLSVNLTPPSIEQSMSPDRVSDPRFRYDPNDTSANGGAFDAELAALKTKYGIK